MIKRMILSGAAALGIAAGMAPAWAAETAPAAASQPGKPALGNWGFDTSGMDRSVKPGDSFYEFANGAWSKKTDIPADRANWGVTAELRNLSDERMRTIIEDSARTGGAPGSNERKVGDYFASFMDEAAIEKAGAAPLKPWLDRVTAIRTKSDLARAFGDGGRMNIGAPFGVGVEQDLKTNTRHAVYVGQGGLGLPDRDYYLDEKNPKFAEARTAYVRHVATMLNLAGLSDAQARAQRIYDLEKKIATAHWTRAEQRQIDKLYNPMTHAELAQKMPGLDWKAYLEAAGVASQPTIIAANPSALAGAAKLVQSEPLETWKDYLRFRTIAATAPYLTKAFVDESFAFNSKTLQGVPQIKDRWKRGVDLVNAGMGEAVGQLYVARYFPPDAKAKADALVRNLIAAMDKRLAALEWMTPETKARARTKLAAFTPKPAGRSRRVGHVSADRERLRQPAVERDRLPGRDPAAALLRSQCRSGGQLRRHRRGHRPRNQPPFRRPGIEVRSHRQHEGMVDSGRCRAVQEVHGQPSQPVRRLRAAAGLEDQRGADARREHRRSGRSHHRLRCLQDEPRRQGSAGARRLYRRSALLPRLRSGLAAEVPRRLPAAAHHHR
jgi:putative endopeptidase